LTGYPDQATELLRELLENKPQGAWTAFRAAFEAKLLPGGVGMTGVVPGTLAERALATDKAAWMELFQKLDGIEGHICVRNMEEFLEWAPRVARYSFQSGRVLLSQHD
jgi:hypothetical protein